MTYNAALFRPMPYICWVLVSVRKDLYISTLHPVCNLCGELHSPLYASLMINYAGPGGSAQWELNTCLVLKQAHREAHEVGYGAVQLLGEA